MFEELLSRGVLFRSVETWFGSWAALVVSSLVFGLTHLINPEATLEGALFIVVEAGILLAAAYMLTRRLWLSIVSGNEAAQGLIRSTIKGPRPADERQLWGGVVRAFAAPAHSCQCTGSEICSGVRPACKC